MASYFTGEIVGVKRKAPEVITMVNGYPHVTYPAFDIVGKILGKNLAKDKFEVKVNNSNCILQVSDCDIFKIDYAGESEIFDSILLNDTLSQYLERSLENLQQNSLYGMHPEYHFTPARRPLKALEELNKREFERIAAEPIRFEIDDMIKANYSKEEIKKMINNTFGVSKYEYKKIIFSGPCTIILWKDGTKTIAKTSSDEEIFDPEKGVAICFMKKMLGHTETNKILRKASEQYKEYIAENRPNSSLDEFIEYLSSLKSKTKSVDQSTIDEVKKVEEEQQDE